MTEAPQDKLRASLVRALQEVERLRKKLGTLEQAAQESIAIIGIGLRLPGGVVDLSSFWTLLQDQVDTVIPVPAARWDAASVYDEDPERAGKTYVRHAAFLDAVDGFDHWFFNISPREVRSIDPQHRLLLEGAWEALETAGIIPASLRESVTGVFVGIGPSDYGLLARSEAGTDAYSVLGTHTSFAAGRIAYTLGLQGPALSLDTACSSSLVALHLACHSLRAGECTLALAAGVQVMAAPDVFIQLARTHAVAPDGRSKTFSDNADGYGRGEGVVVLALERLSLAEANRRNILAVIRGSAVNHDGPSSGIAAPNGTSQQKVLRAALADARLRPAEIDVVECHGTGTSLGDPIEVQALAAVYGEGRPSDRPLLLGAVKTNIGHLESAAGLAGIAKIIAAMQHGTLPATIHTKPRNRHIDWDSLPVEVVDSSRAWPKAEGARYRAGVSAFGLSGTNAHVILEGAVEHRPAVEQVEFAHEVPVLLSARTLEGVGAQVKALHRWSERHPAKLRDVAYSLAKFRTSFEHRLALVASDSSDLAAELSEYEAGRMSSNMALSRARIDPKLAMLFTGQGAQRVGMGLGLHAGYSVFRSAFDEVCANFDPWLDRSLREVVFTDEARLLDQTAYTQPALFALEVALFRLYESWGVQPQVVLGHSIGELVAAHVAGVLTLEDACRLVAARGRLMQAQPPGGAMASIQASEHEILALLERYPEVDIAGLNGPRSTVVSGEEASVLALAEHFEGLGRKTKRLTVSHAFHSRRMDGMLEEFRAIVSTLRPSAPKIPIVSNVTGRLATIEELGSSDYWVVQVRQAVRFGDCVRTLEEQGVSAMLELGPHGVLIAMAANCLSDAARERTTLLASLRNDRAETATLALTLAAIHGHGVEVDWDAYFGPLGAQQVALPTYAFQRQRHWLETSIHAATDVAAAGLESSEHPLFGAMVRLADTEGYLFTARLSLAAQPWLAEHVVFDHVLFPGTGFLDLALTAAGHVGAPRIEELTLEAPLVLESGQPCILQLLVEKPDDAGRRRLTIYSKFDDAAQTWTLHASGSLGSDDLEVTFEQRVWPPPGAEEIDLSGLYESLASAGLAYGPSFRGLVRAWDDGGIRYAEVRLPEGRSVEGFTLHPALLDAALHALAVDQGDVITLPFAWSGVSIAATGATGLRVRFTPKGTGAFALDLADAAGHPLATIDALATRPASGANIRDALARRQIDSLYRVEWQPLTGLARATGKRVLVGGDEGLAGALGMERVEDLDSLPEGVDAVFLAKFDASTPLAASVDLLGQLQAWLADPRRVATRLVILTRHAVAVDADEDILDRANATLWGLVRTARAEHPDRELMIIDIDASSESLRGLSDAANSGEQQLALRGDRVFTARLVAVSSSDVLATPPGARAWYLETPVRGTLENLQFVAHDELLEPLTAGQVRIQVRATGINFRDVLNALGMYPGDPGPLGYEGAGVVLELGPGVDSFAVGDRVFGLLRAGFGTHSVVDQRMLARLPLGWSFARAASVPLVFLTAYYALVDLAGLRSGQRILIHSAAGGVGMAATQLARHLGAEVFGTASPGKWDTLRALGFDDSHLANSRTLEFEAQFLAATKGEGVDVVLDALAREFVDGSLRLLPRGGRFLEMGKTDVREPAEIAAQHPGVAYRAFDLVEAGLDRIQAMLVELIELFERGVLELLPIKTWDVRNAVEAFRFVGQAKHVGKVVLEAARTFDPKGTVLITGGTGGLGSQVARHLVARGVTRHLLLVARRGRDSPGANELVEELEAAGAKVSLLAGDVSDRAFVAEVLAAVPTEHPLTAVVHTAGVLADGVLASLDADSFARVFRPKVDAASHLHELTIGMDLAAFVVFSSAAGVLGSPGQANYAAANTYLDALCVHRRHLGEPAISLAWGPWSGGGMAARLTSADRERLRRQGTPPLTMDEGLALLDVACARPEPALTPLRIDADALGSAAGLPAMLRGLARSKRQRVVVTETSVAELGARIASMTLDEQRSFLLEFVRTEAAMVLGVGAIDSLSIEQPLQELGLDSLMAVELRNRLQSRTQLHLPSTLLFDYPTAAAMADYLLSVLAPTLAKPADSGDGWLKQRIAAIPISRLRESGLLAALLQLAGDATSELAGVDSDAIDEMSIDDLVNLALANDEG